MATGKLGNSKIETQRSREARRQGSREVGKQQSKDAGKKGSRVSDKHGNREAGKHGAGKEGCRLARNYGNREAVKQGKEAGTQGSMEASRGCTLGLSFQRIEVHESTKSFPFHIGIYDRSGKVGLAEGESIRQKRIRSHSEYFESPNGSRNRIHSNINWNS